MSPKVVIRAPNHLGDCIMALPMINDAREAHPGASISVLVPENLADLFRPNPALDAVLPLSADHVHGLIAVIRIKDLLSRHAFDIGYILPPSFGAAAGFKLGGVSERIGYIADGRRLLLTKALPLPTPITSTHRSELYYNLLRRGSGAELEFTRPKLFLSEDDVDAASRLLAGFGITDGEPFVAIGFRAVAESRRWGRENYTELAKGLIATTPYKLVLIGTQEDVAEGDEIVAAAGTGRVVSLAGKTSIRELAALLSLARLFIGNDSGPAHLASAVGAPLVVLSGADEPASTSPLAATKRLLYCDELECISCVKNKCPLKGEQYMQCMVRISVDDVLAATHGILELQPV